MIKYLPVIFCWGLLVFSGSSADFNRDIRPILSDKCFACHGFDEKERKADLRLDTREGAFADLGGHSALVAGDLAKSEAWYRITTDDEDDLMPPPKFHKPLTAREKELIKGWIEEGAEYKTHWSYAPLQKKDIPAAGSAIDYFIRKQLKEAGLKPSGEADRITLARRLHFDLLGLPPSPELVEKFAKDSSPDSYEKLVDRLLADPAFGERLAVYWLDLVRYADTIGYHSDNYMEVSAYRDYVIEAFNRNLPYDQFTIEQLAGDLLPDATLQQRIASGYNRLLQSTEEGGAQAAEYMVIHAADRVRNVSGVWLGSTIGCAQCHDHKYDPFTTRDFYSLAAFFADVKEKPIGKRQPNLKLPTDREKAKIAELEQKLKDLSIEAVLTRDTVLSGKVDAAQVAWEQEILSRMAGKGTDIWTVTNPAKMKSSGGQKFTIQDDQSILTSGPNPAKDNYTFDLAGSGKVSAFRLEALQHDSFPGKSLSRDNGNFVLSEVKVSYKGKPVKITVAKASYEQKSWPIVATLDGKNATGWAVDGHTDKKGDREAMFVFEKAVDLGKGGSLTVELHHQSAHGGHNIGRLRLSLTDSVIPAISGAAALPGKVLASLKIPKDKRSEAQKNELGKYYRDRSPLLAGIKDQQKKTKAELEGLNKGIKTMLVSESLEKPRVTRILNRGDWLDKDGEVVNPALPAFLPRDGDLPPERRANRLDLAKWIMAESNPLTARTFVNRIWMLLFGEGISRNVDDLGGQGKPPTHPELLNHLAIQFREKGWDVKGLVKEIVLSDTYRQASTAAPEVLERDPTNLLWARQGRWRIEAEFVRDSALVFSDLLVKQIGGKSVKPYQPAGYWQHLNFPRRSWQAGKNEDLYRRGLYTYWCRSFPHPAMVSFDAPSREECSSKRSRSNIPQQALALLNDPQFVEASRKFGERIAAADGDEIARIRFAWKIATSRPISDEESAVLLELFTSQKHKYSKAESAAKEFLGIGNSKRDESIPLAEAAAWTQVARAILNTYETTSRN